MTNPVPDVDKLIAAATEFCRKVEAGEARSVRSYVAFKQALIPGIQPCALSGEWDCMPGKPEIKQDGKPTHCEACPRWSVPS